MRVTNQSITWEHHLAGMMIGDLSQLKHWVKIIAATATIANHWQISTSTKSCEVHHPGANPTNGLASCGLQLSDVTIFVKSLGPNIPNISKT